MRALILSVKLVLFFALMRLPSSVTRVLLTPDASLACTRIARLLDTHALRTPATVTVGLVVSLVAVGAGGAGGGACSSKAPMSQPPNCGRVTSRWSVAAHVAASA